MKGLNNFKNNPDSEFQKNELDLRILKSSRGKVNPVKPHTKDTPKKVMTKGKKK